MISIILRQYDPFLVDFGHGKITFDDGTDLIPYINHIIGTDGSNLILNIMNPDTHKRWCCWKALLHPYFKDIISQDGGVWRSHLTMINDTVDDFIDNSMELCYYDNIHNNYENNLLKSGNNEGVYGKYYRSICEWVIDGWNMRSDIFISFDSLLNSLNVLRSICTKSKKSDIQALVLILNMIYDKILLFNGASDQDYIDIVSRSVGYKSKYLYSLMKKYFVDKLHK